MMVDGMMEFSCNEILSNEVLTNCAGYFYLLYAEHSSAIVAVACSST